MRHVVPCILAVALLATQGMPAASALCTAPRSIAGEGQQLDRYVDPLTCTGPGILPDLSDTTEYALDEAFAAAMYALDGAPDPDETTAYATQQANETAWFLADTYSEVIPTLGFLPCVSMNVTIERPVGEPFHAEQPRPPVCRASEMHVEYRATPFGGRGAVELAFDSENVSDLQVTSQSLDVRPLPTSPLRALLWLLPGGRAEPLPEPPAPLPRQRVVVHVAFEVAWGGDCRDARGTFAARVNGEMVQQDAPAGLFHDLCVLSTSPDATLALRAAAMAAGVASALVPDVQLPPFAALAEQLSRLFPAMPNAPQAPATPDAPSAPDAPRAPDAPAAPDAPEPSPPTVEGAEVDPHPPTDEGERAAGDATLTLLGAGPLAEGEWSAAASAPVARASAQGAAQVAPPIDGLWASAPLAWPDGADAPEPDPTPAPREGWAAPGAPPPAPQPGASGGAAPEPGPRLVVASGSGAAGVADEPPLLAGVAAAAGAVLLLAAFALYQRITRANALKHEGRAALLRACQAQPCGATSGELAAATGMQRKTAEYHLRYLARLGLLRVDRAPDGPRRYALPTAARPEAQAASLDACVLARIREQPGASTGDLARDLGVDRRRVDRRVKDLLLGGLIESRVERGTRRLYPA